MLVETDIYNFQINFKHYYLPQLRNQSDGTVRYELHPKATKCTIKRIDKETLKLDTYEGYSVCSDNDQFSKDVGRFNALINCLRHNFTKSYRKEIVVEYLLQYRFSKLEKIALNSLELNKQFYKYFAIKKSNLDNTFYNWFVRMGSYYADEFNSVYQTDEYLTFDSSKQNSKEFVRNCILEKINLNYKQYYS